MLSKYQQLTNRPNLLNYLVGQGIYGNIYAINMEVSYNAGAYMDLVKQ
jgi:hypothetical protein